MTQVFGGLRQDPLAASTPDARPRRSEKRSVEPPHRVAGVDLLYVRVHDATVGGTRTGASLATRSLRFRCDSPPTAVATVSDRAGEPTGHRARTSVAASEFAGPSCGWSEDRPVSVMRRPPLVGQPGCEACRPISRRRKRLQVCSLWSRRRGVRPTSSVSRCGGTSDAIAERDIDRRREGFPAVHRAQEERRPLRERGNGRHGCLRSARDDTRRRDSEAMQRGHEGRQPVSSGSGARKGLLPCPSIAGERLTDSFTDRRGQDASAC